MDDISLSDENAYSEDDDSETFEEKSPEEERGRQDNVEDGHEFDREFALNSIEEFGKINQKETTR